MKKIIKILILLLLQIGSLISAGAQQIQSLTKPFLEFKDNTLIISYSFPRGCKTAYKVWIDIKDSKGNQIEAFSLSGDVGPNIDPGPNKRIVWNMDNDNVFLNDSISVRILAEQMPKHFSKLNLLASSALLPGLGQSKISGRAYWLVGIVSYGSLAGSYWFNRKAIDSYELYINSEVREDNDSYFSKTIFQNNTSKVLAYSSLALWTANIVWMAIMPANRSNENKRITIGLKPEVYNSGNTISFYLTLNLSQ